MKKAMLMCFLEYQLLEKSRMYDSMARLEILRDSLRKYMAKVCDITGKRSRVGGRYSNRTRATQFNPCGKVLRRANIQKKRIYIPELKKSVTVAISTKGMRMIAKNGAYKTLTAAGLI